MKPVCFMQHWAMVTARRRPLSELTHDTTWPHVIPWWRHQMETFSALQAICAGNSPVTGEFPTKRPVTRSYDVCFDLRLKKRLSKQWWGWWFETQLRPLWRHCDTIGKLWGTWHMKYKVQGVALILCAWKPQSFLSMYTAIMLEMLRTHRKHIVILLPLTIAFNYISVACMLIVTKQTRL